MKKNVLFIIPTLCRAGAEMQVTDLLCGIDRATFNVFLITFGSDLSLLERIKEFSLKHENYKRKSKVDFSMAFKISKFIDNNEIDVIHSSLQIALLFAWLGRMFSKRQPPIINVLHKTANRNLKEFYLEKLVYQWPMRACKKIICVCKSQENFWCSQFPFMKSKTDVIYNGVNTTSFDSRKFDNDGRELRLHMDVPKDSQIISCIAGFRIEKNHGVLIEAFERLCSINNNVFLVLAGDGPERQRIEAIVKQKNLKEKICFLGRIDDVRSLLAASSLSVLASNAIETFSIAMLESMAMKCPVITTDIGGHKEAVIPGVTGEVVPINDIDALTEALKKCLNDITALNKMGERARNKVVEMFSLSLMLEKTEEALLEVCESQKK
ncbi:MAG: glycosyltransferase family 4 protein [Proteobacteria bacterium]|nr:glycosyltransferase family 4 protein [Pseudomonadota bacterium]